MKIKWYWLAEQLGLMEDLSDGNGTSVLYRVSAKADDFFQPPSSRWLRYCF